MEKNENKSLEEKLSNLAYILEKAQIREYVSLLENPKKLLYMNFLAGVARGLGMAVGFTLLGALVIYFLQKMVLLNLPFIGDLIADIVQMVREQSY
ncbi:MAG: hypothetical protein APF76_05350 [Desulfitibacter sp. BRH_c19]|nr:MAG: hypothetical protein APF76_05350 [Desulfitibacter sp. BRH_c19]